MKRSPIHIATLAAMAWYLSLVVLHYFNQRPLWLDEGFVLSSLKEFSPSQIFTKPLLHNQGFPRVYLWMAQLLSSRFDFHVLSLRFFSFVFMLIAFGCWMGWAARQWQGRKEMVLTFALCWSASIPLIYYGAELKPYSMDVLAGIIFLWALSRQKDWLGRDRLGRCWIYCALPLLCLLSYPAFFLMPFPLYNILRLVGRDRRFWLLAIGYIAACCMAVLFVYIFDIRVSNAGNLQVYWHEYFISFASWGEFFKSFGEGVNNLIGRWFAESPKWIRGGSRVFLGCGLLYLLVSAWRCFKSDNYFISSARTFGAIIFLELVALGALHIYPFSVPRMELFFCPFLLMAAIDALVWLRQRQKHLYLCMHTLFVIFLLYVAVGITHVVLAGDLGAQSVIWAIQ